MSTSPSMIPRECQAPAEASADAISVLLVDDDEDCRMLVRDAVRLCNPQPRVFEATDGKQAVDFLYHRGYWAEAPRPSLIFLDIEMPGMGGQEVLKIIKADPSLRDIPVVMVTGVSDEGQMRQAAEAGANSYTLKPAKAEQFFQTLMASANYWLTIHQYPDHHLPSDQCRI